jgi:hypothetical protein
MTTARIASIASLHHEAMHQLGHALTALRARLIDAPRRRHQERRMLLAVQDLEHSGVLADMQASIRPIPGVHISGR